VITDPELYFTAGKQPIKDDMHRLGLVAG